MCNRSKGIYNNIRLVMGLKDSYYLSAKYREYKTCNRAYIAYDERYNRCVQFVCNSNGMYNEQDPMLTDRQYLSTISGHIDTEVCV